MRGTAKSYEDLRTYLDTVPIVDCHDHSVECGPAYDDPIQVVIGGYFHSDIQSASSDADIAVLDDKTRSLEERWPVLEHLVWRSQEGMLFRWPVVVASLLVSSALLICLQLLPYPKSAEEERQEALRRASRQED